MPKIFGENFWVFQSSISDGLGYYLCLTGLHCPSPWPLLVSIAMAIMVCCIFKTPPFILDLAAVFLLHFLSSHFAAYLNWILLLVLILNAIPFISYHLAYFLHLQALVRPRIAALQYFSIFYFYYHCLQNLWLEWDNQDGIEELQACIGFALVTMGISFQFAHLLNILGHPRPLREAAE